MQNVTQNLVNKMIVTVFGAERDEFKSDEGNVIPFCRLYAGNNCVAKDAIGYKVNAMKADPAVFDDLRTQKLPAEFLLEVNIRSTPTGQQIRVMNAKPFTMPEPAKTAKV